MSSASLPSIGASEPSTSNKLDVSLLYKYRSDSLQSGASSATYSRKNSNASFAPGPAETYTIGDSVPLEEEGEEEDAADNRHSYSSQSARAVDERVRCVVDFPAPRSVALLSFISEEFHSFIVFMRIIFFHQPFDIFLAWAVSAGSTCFFYYWKPKDSGNEHLSFNLNWTMLSIALVFPLTMTLSETFRRREQALVFLSQLKVNILSLFMAHCDWDWYSIPVNQPQSPSLSGRRDVGSKESTRLNPAHCAELLVCLHRFLDLTFSVLSSPRTSRAVSFYTQSGRANREEVARIADQLDEAVVVLYHEISQFGERIKEAGLPAGEKSRLTAFENSLYLAYVQLRTIKDYRSPMELRAFARVFIIILPIVFGPYYALVAQSTSLSWSICFSCLTSMAMQGLLNIRHALEDPFTPLGQGRLGLTSKSTPFSQLLAICGDQIDLEFELTRLRRDLKLIFDKKSPDDLHTFFSSSKPAP